MLASPSLSSSTLPLPFPFPQKPAFLHSKSTFHGVRIASPNLSSSSLRAQPSSSSTVMMSKKYEDLKEIRTKTNEQINDEILQLKGELFMLRLRRSAREDFKPSDFGSLRKKIVELPHYPVFLGAQFQCLIAAPVAEMDDISGSLAVVHDPLLAERPKYNYIVPAPWFNNILFKDNDRHCNGSIQANYPNDDHIHKDRANGTLNGVYSDRSNVVLRNGNALHGSRSQDYLSSY